ncbi:carboxypeptidase A1-like [Cyprinus carpio]|uniref:Carboxypeptidase A1-like n=1 Tax=Cyprinus carpio TaxID=7962 RepID=A0A9Q9VI41_CYPCA|nr:carboxypeptidase A1-like [Cyprinus carpio]
MRLYLAVFALLAAVHCEELFNGDQVLRIHAESESHIHALKELEEDVEFDLDFWTHGFSTERPVDIHVPHSSLYAVKDFLKKNNIPFTVIINNVQFSTGGVSRPAIWVDAGIHSRLLLCGSPTRLLQTMALIPP